MAPSAQASDASGPDWLGVRGIAGGAGGLALAAALLLAAGRRLTFAYHPYGGVVGLPALLDYAPRQELFFYLAGLIAFFAAGWAGWSAGRRSLWVAWGLLLAGVAVGAASLVGNMVQSAMLLKSIVRSAAAGELVLFALCAAPLLLRPAPGAPEPERAGPPDFAAWMALVGPVWVHESVLLAVYLPAWPVALGLAAGLAYVEGRLLLERERPRRGQNVLMWLEAAAWVALAVAPIAAWGLRLRLALDRPIPGPRALAWFGLAVAAAPVLFGALRCRLRYRPLVRPVALVPFTVLPLLALATGVQTSLDAFHMGELMYPPRALAAGLKPWADIFYVHGFGVDTFFGALVGRPTERLQGLVVQAASLSSAFGVALGVWAMLRLWGGRWWLLALVAGALAFEGTGWASCRYLPLWIVLLLVAESVRTGRLRWLALAGAAGWLGAFFSLDTGSTLLAALFVHSVLWGLFGDGRGARRLRPALALLLGVAAAAVPTLLWMLAAGVLDDFVRVNWQYLLVKRHYDKIPISMGSLVVFVAPAATVAGAWASAKILGRGERTPLAAAIVLLTLVTPLAYLRAFDRSDFGHQIYGALPAWPLLACLAVWWASRAGRPCAMEALWRSALLALILIVYPFADPLLCRQPAGEPPVYRIDAYLHNFVADARLPLAGPPADAPTIDFFKLVGRLDALPPSDAFYDFSNQPALYAFSGRTCPTPFFTPFYASGEQWQAETVAALDRRGVRWVLWRGPTEYWNAPDFIPNCVRQWKIASYLVAHYRPVRVLPGNSVLLERNGGVQAGVAALGRELWLTAAEVNLHALPQVWGRERHGVPPAPARRIGRPLTVDDFSGPWAMDLSPAAAEATEVWIWLSRPVAGSFKLQWFDRAGAAAPPIRLDVSPDFRGPYRVMLSNMPHWVWPGPPSRIELTADRPPGGQLRLEFRKP